MDAGRLGGRKLALQGPPVDQIAGTKCMTKPAHNAIDLRAILFTRLGTSNRESVIETNHAAKGSHWKLCRET
jgi:hypothetical protein